MWFFALNTFTRCLTHTTSFIWIRSWCKVLQFPVLGSSAKGMNVRFNWSVITRMALTIDDNSFLKGWNPGSQARSFDILGFSTHSPATPCFIKYKRKLNCGSWTCRLSKWWLMASCIVFHVCISKPMAILLILVRSFPFNVPHHIYFLTNRNVLNYLRT